MAGAHRTPDEICRFLALSIFQALSPKSIFVGEVDSSGILNHVSSFGFDEDELARYAKLSLTLNLPITEAVLTNKCVIIESPEVFIKKYPVANSLGVDDFAWKSCIAVPIVPYGVYFLVLQSKPKKDLEFEPFLRSVGHLLSLSLLRKARSPIPAPSASPEPKKLTQRQNLVMNLLSKGFTNAQIAQEIGYSESLVRQETIAIYAALRVSGRRELIKFVDEEESATA
jgi:DNA-binding CsgD family transcriptional regulator